MRGRAALGALAAALWAAGCGPGGGQDGGVVVDTLASGAVRVMSPETGRWREGEGWRLVEDLRIGTVDGTRAEVFEDVRGLVVDGSGRLVVLEGRAREVRVFGPDGTLLTAFGRQGEGPGEFQAPGGLALDGSGNIWIVDGRLRRYSVFTPAGELVREIPRYTQGQVFPWPGTVLPDGGVVDVEMEFGEGGPSYRFPVFDASGSPVGEVRFPDYQARAVEIVSGGGRARYGVPYAPGLARAWDPAGAAWAGIAEDYTLARLDLRTGDTTRVVSRQWTPVPLSDAERESAAMALEHIASQGGDVDDSMIPEHHPAFRAIHPAADGHLWVEVPAATPAGYGVEDLLRVPPTFDVFEPGGRYLGQVASPVGLRNTVITGSHVYGVTQDSMDVRYLVRLRIEGKSGG